MLNLFQHLSIVYASQEETLKHPSDRPGGSSGWRSLSQIRHSHAGGNHEVLSEANLNAFAIVPYAQPLPDSPPRVLFLFS